MSIKSISTRRISAQSVESGSTTSFNVDNGNTYISGAYVNSSSNAYLQIVTTGSTANNVPLRITPIVTSISVADSGYNVLDDTAVNTAGGYIVINGQNFTNSCVVYFDGSIITSSFVSKTQLRAVVPAKSAGSYTVIVADGNNAGVFASVAVSAFPTWSTTSYTSTSFTVSIQLVAAGDAPLSYSLVSGTLPSGLSLSSSGLISGTVTQSSTTADLVFQVEDGQNQSTQSTISLVIFNADPYWSQTILSWYGNENVITDASNNEFIATPAGDARSAVFNPFGDRKSVFFNGANSSLSASSSTAFDQDVNFTVELWVKAIAFPGSDSVHLYRPDGAGGTLAISLTSAGKIGIDDQQTGYIITSTATLSLGIWYHVALSRTGPTTSNVLLFINGALDTTVSYSNWQNNATTAQIGSRTDVARNLNGYISNLRVNKGNALYTAAFTPQRGTLIPNSAQGTSNVVFLSCHANTIIDSSTTAATITANGVTSVVNSGPTWESYTLKNDGSLALDGTGDYVTFPANSAFQFSNNNFTVELWVFPRALPAEAVLVSKWNAGGTAASNQWILSLNSGVPTFACSTDGSATAANATGTTLITNTWNHVAAVRNGSSLKVYVNGLGGTANTSLSTSSLYGSETEVLGVSYRRNNGSTQFPLNGYISNLRIVKGQALYTADFSSNVATSMLTTTSQGANSSNVSLLTFRTNINFTNGVTLDGSPNDYTITRSSGTYIGSQSPAGANNWCVYFSGTTQYVAPVANAVLAVGTGDFCFEAWAWPATNTGIKYIGSTGAAGTGTWQLGVNAASGAVRVFKENNTQLFNDTTAVLTLDAWNHVALVRSGANTGVYINGTLANTIADSTNYSNTSLVIGAGNTAGGQGWQGYLSSVRLIKGAPVYTSNFTAPSTNRLTANSITSILTCDKCSIEDSSPNALTITGRTSGGVYKFSPYSDGIEYDPATHGGSLYFNNSSDYLSVASNTNLTPSNGDYTLEGWFWQTGFSGSTAETILDTSGSSTTNALNFSCSLAAATPGYVLNISGTNRITSGSGATIFKSSEWQHVAISRVGTTTKMFINGAQVGSNFTDTITYLAGGFTMGRGFSGANFLGGYISSFRFIKGKGIYSSAFTPDPNTPLAPIAGTQFLLSGSHSAVADTARHYQVTTNFGARTSSNRQFSNTSLTFDGTGDYLGTADTFPQFPQRAATTFDAWIYPTSVSKSQFIFDSRATTLGPGISLVMNASGNLTAYSSGVLIISSTGQPAINTWSHVALVRYANSSVSIFLNGSSVGSNNTAQATLTDYTYRIGTAMTSLTDSATDHFQGYIDEPKYAVSVAKYTPGSSYVVPTTHGLNY